MNVTASSVEGTESEAPAAKQPGELGDLYNMQESVVLESKLLPGKRFHSHDDMRAALRREAVVKAYMVVIGSQKAYTSEKALRAAAEKTTDKALHLADMGLTGQPDIAAMFRFHENNAAGILPFNKRARRTKMKEEEPAVAAPVDNEVPIPDPAKKKVAAKKTAAKSATKKATDA